MSQRLCDQHCITNQQYRGAHVIYNLGNRIVNNYLVSIDDGYVLIDTGYAGGFPVFLKRLRQLHIDPGQIRLIFLTHAHDDHAGFLNEVLGVTDAPVILHPKALEGLRRGQNSFEGGCSSRLAWLFCQILALLGKGQHRYPCIDAQYSDRLVIVGSEKFKSMRLPFEVIETPGHTADHISLLKDGICFCGDAAMNDFPSTKRVIIWIENLQDYKNSWQKILSVHPAMIYPAHGKPFQTSDLQKYLSHLDNVKLYPLRPR